MDADEKQFAVLFPRVKSQNERSIQLLQGEVDKNLQPAWKDPPFDPAWKRPDLNLVQKLEGAQGVLEERFAFCQTMLLNDFLGVAEDLRPCGYRPIRFRPYAVGQAVQVAAVWTRDRQNWKSAHGLPAEAMRQRNAEYAKQSFSPVDVAPYLSNEKEHYAALWAQGSAEIGPAPMVVGQDYNLLQKLVPFLEEKGFRSTVCSFLVGNDG
jgi:hypothetical protein